LAQPTGSHRSWASVYGGQLFHNTLVRQRWLILGGGTAYAIACLWVSFRVGTPPAFAMASLGLLAFTLAVYGLTYAKNARLSLLETNPALMAAAVSAHMVLGAASAPQGGGARLAALLTLVSLWVLIASPTRRATLAALATMTAVVAGGLFAYLPTTGVTHFGRGEALSYWLPALAATIAAAFYLERERQTAFDLRMELERRATSDNLTGVSNRAHINLLAQNEFARARRYREPFSCLMIEIDAYEDLIAQWSDAAATVVVQVFSGYCVVVMRHCDSFGRLSPARFLALLPETHGQGAHALASRMCRDLSNLEVMVGGSAVKFTVSIGAAELHPTDRWAGDLLRRVEQGLDDAIERGRNQAIFASPPAPPPAIADDDLDMTEGSGLFPSR
jgi:diguanylate cyclase (GGDEF)-like protein